jgi:hypothetical protein
LTNSVICIAISQKYKQNHLKPMAQINYRPEIINGMTDAQRLGKFMKILSVDRESGNLLEVIHDFKSKEERRQMQSTDSFCTVCGCKTTPNKCCSESCEEIFKLQ